MFKFKNTLLSIMLFILVGSVSYASGTQKEWIETGDDFFNRRGEGHDSDWAPVPAIEKSLSAYLKAYESGNPSEELFVKILNASYFYATYAERDGKKQKDILQQAVRIGEDGLRRYPDSAGLNYWMAGIWGRWGEVNGIFASARAGVAGRIRSYAEKTITVDPAYAEGGGYRALGRLHFKAPRVPFILSWPDKEEALKFLNLAVETAPENLTNHLFYAESLYNAGKIEESLEELKLIMNAGVNPGKMIENMRDKKEAETLYKQILKTKMQAQKN